ncbi:hypothetical protein ACJX0J_024035, partial [Zea mays]
TKYQGRTKLGTGLCQQKKMFQKKPNSIACCWRSSSCSYSTASITTRLLQYSNCDSYIRDRLAFGC